MAQTGKKVTSVSSSKPIAHGVGRRKKSVARVWLKRGSGKMVVNGLAMDSYFDTDVTRSAASTPLRVVPIGENFDVMANVVGGGKAGQADAIKLGIARALDSFDSSLHLILKQHSLLTVDSRNKERKKYGQRGARRKFQFVKR